MVVFCPSSSKFVFVPSELKAIIEFFIHPLWLDLLIFQEALLKKVKVVLS